MNDWVFFLLWLLVVVLLAGPALRRVAAWLGEVALWWWGELAYRRRVRSGKWPFSQFPTCSKCGYDLRSSPDRCPECGQELDPLDSVIVRYRMSLGFKKNRPLRFRRENRR